MEYDEGDVDEPPDVDVLAMMFGEDHCNLFFLMFLPFLFIKLQEIYVPHRRLAAVIYVIPYFSFRAVCFVNHDPLTSIKNES